MKNVCQIYQTESGDYRLVVADKNQVVENIFEGSFRLIMDELLKLGDPQRTLRIRKK